MQLLKSLQTLVVRILRLVITVRRLMIAVVVVACGFAAHELLLRQARLQQRYRQEQNWNSNHRGELLAVAYSLHLGRSSILSFTSPARFAYHTEMEAKYEHAARYPWLIIPSDPPEPD